MASSSSYLKRYLHCALLGVAVYCVSVLGGTEQVWVWLGYKYVALLISKLFCSI